MLPYDLKHEYPQFILGVLGLGVFMFILIAPWTLDNSIVHVAMAFVLIGIGILSIILEFCLDTYRMVPVDLYDTGLKVVIEDPKLLQEI